MTPNFTPHILGFVPIEKPLVHLRDTFWRVAAAVWQKEEGHKIGQADFVRPSKTMSQIGG